MKLRVCVVPECSSSSANQPHLAYHKFPSCPDTKRIWLNRMKLSSSDLRHHTPQICSKHFRKDDYLPYHKTSKRMLKKGALPSIFPWGSCDPMPSAAELHQEKSRHKQTETPTDREPTDGAESTPADDSAVTTVSDSGGLDDSFEDVLGTKEADLSKRSDLFKDSEESFSKRMIESENSDHGSATDASTPEKNDCKQQGAGKYLPGSRLEAKDLSSNKWYKAKVVEVDWEDDELLIHFEKWSQRFDEWIPMDSSRLRPVQGHSPIGQSAFRVGETVMASWSDNKKYAARIKSILSGDKYEVLFFDGFCKVVKGHKISKGTEETLAMDPGLFHNAGATTMTKAERRERKRKIGPVAELFQIKKKNAAAAEPEKSVGTARDDVKVALTFDDRKHDAGRSRQRAFPVLKGFAVDADESKSKTSTPSEKKSRPKVASGGGGVYDRPTAGSSKETAATPTQPARARRRKRDDNIDPSDYANWEPEGEEAWLVESAAGFRRSIRVKDDRLPSGWEKHSIQRASGNSAGKWDVFLVSPTGRRFRSRKEMVAYFTDTGEEYKPELFDFTLRCGMRRRSADSEHFQYKKKPARKDGKTQPAAVADAEAAAAAEASVAPPPPSRRVKTLLPKSSDERGSRPVSPPPPHPTSQGASLEPQADDQVNDITARITTATVDSGLCQNPSSEIEKSAEEESRSHNGRGVTPGNGFDAVSWSSLESSSSSSSTSSLGSHFAPTVREDSEARPEQVEQTTTASNNFHIDHDYLGAMHDVVTSNEAPTERRDIVKGDCRLFASAVEFALCEMESCTREVVKLEIQQIFVKYSHSLANF